MVRRGLMTAVLSIIILAGGGLAAEGALARHPGQHVGLTFSITDDAVTCEILISNDLLNLALLTDADDAPDITDPDTFSRAEDGDEYQLAQPEVDKQLRAYVETFVQHTCTITINNEPVDPQVQKLEFIPATMPGYPGGALRLPPDGRITITYPASEHPKRVGMVWDLFPQDASRAAFGLEPAIEVIAELSAGDENKIIVFTPDEPEIVWHAPTKPAAQRISPVVVAVEPVTIQIPLISVGIVAVWGIALLGLRFSRYWTPMRRPALALSVLPLVIALAAHSAAVARIASPWGKTVKPPTDEEAAALFERLQRNVYKAFEKTTESDIYDVLAQSVDGELLDRIYNEVYQSLILRDQGGAIARVQAVDILEALVKSAGLVEGSQTAAFQVQSRWRVRGAVYHWGHVHSRTNEYQALYTIAQRGEKWKITNVDVLEQRRIISDDDDPLVPPQSVGGEAM